MASPWTIVAATGAWLIVAALSFVAWKRSGYRPAIGALEALRLLIVAIVGLLINQPEWVEQFHPHDKPSIAVLWDASASMTTHDAMDGESPTAPPRSRLEAIKALTQPETWETFRER